MKLSNIYFVEIMYKEKALECYTFEEIKPALDFINSLDYSSISSVVFALLT